MRVRKLRTEQWLPQPIDKVFAFFSDAGNLEILTPPWLHFRILTPDPLLLQQGSLLEYRIRWRFVPLTWKTEISVWEPPYRFVDQQLRGPYRRWIHEHTFEERDGGTLVKDRVDYAIPGWFLEPLLYHTVVGADVRRILAYRQAKMKELFNTQTSPSGN